MRYYTWKLELVSNILWLIVEFHFNDQFVFVFVKFPLFNKDGTKCLFLYFTSDIFYKLLLTTNLQSSFSASVTKILEKYLRKFLMVKLHVVYLQKLNFTIDICEEFWQTDVEQLPQIDL